MDNPLSAAAWARSRILLSFLSALAGWCAASVYLLFYLIVTIIRSPHLAGPPEAEWLVGFSFFMGVVVFFVWLFLLVPLAQLVPPNWTFWRINVLPFIGAVTGPSIMLFLSLYEESGYGIPLSVSAILSDIRLGAFLFGAPSLIVGAVTGYVAAILNRRHLAASRHSPQV